MLLLSRLKPPDDETSVVSGAVVADAPVVPAVTLAGRKVALEARFCEVFTLKAEAEQKVRELHDELMRIQGAIQEVTSPTE